MNKKLIRLTESDLHRIVRESVNRVLNEVKFGGESLHGNNPTDWAAVKDLRNDLADHYGEEDERHPKFFGNLRKASRNSDNLSSLLDKENAEHGQDIYHPEARWREYAHQHNGRIKARNMRKNLGF